MPYPLPEHLAREVALREDHAAQFFMGVEVEELALQVARIGLHQLFAMAFHKRRELAPAPENSPESAKAAAVRHRIQAAERFMGLAVMRPRHHRVLGAAEKGVAGLTGDRHVARGCRQRIFRWQGKIDDRTIVVGGE